MWNFDKLAKELKEITPNAKKDGKWAYADGVGVIKIRLKSFSQKFPEYINSYTEEDVIEAYKKYMKDTTNFDGSISRYRKLLKYFIWKQEDDGDISSVLCTYLDNKDNEMEDIQSVSEDEIDWMGKVV